MEVVWVHSGSWKSHAAISYIGVHNAWSFAEAGYKTYLLMPDLGEDSPTDTDLREFYGLERHPNLRIERVRATRAWWNFRHPYFTFAENFVEKISRQSRLLVLTREQRFLPQLSRLAKLKDCFCLFEPHNFYANQSWRTPSEISAGDRKRGKLEMKYLPKIHGIVTITEDQLELYKKAMPSIQGLNAPLGVKCFPHPNENEIELRRKRRTVAYIGHLMRSKGIPNLLSVAVSLAQEGIRTSIFGGSAAEAEQLTSSVSRIDNAITISPFLPPVTMFKALAEAASIGIVALEESFYNRHLTCPVKALDFLALGMPIVGSDLPSIRNVVGNAGLFFPPGDVGEMRRQIVRLLDDPELYTSLSQKAMLRAKSSGWDVRARVITEWCKTQC